MEQRKKQQAYVVQWLRHRPVAAETRVQFPAWA
jgi:hypothetical protein